MTDPSAQQPTEEEIRAYIAQLREADPAVSILEAYRMLGQHAELKLGRPDARLLIDAMSALVESTAGRVDAQLSQQMRDAIGQLQVAQVQAESESGAQEAPRPGGDAQGAAEPGAGQPAAGQPGAAQQGQPAEPSMTDRLWIPGRDPKG